MWLVLEHRWPNAHRIAWALRLSRDVETCRDLLAGRPVDPSRIDREELERAKARQLVQLVAPLELFTEAA